MLTKEAFVSKFSIPPDRLENCSLGWNELERIYDAYQERRELLKPTLSYLVESLQDAPNVHSVRARLKDPEHLIEKLIRKASEKDYSSVTAENYAEHITDLIGIRVLHLFKEEWKEIHDFLLKKWEQVEKPTANIRDGDEAALEKLLTDAGCDILRHEFGYRSIHYLISCAPSKRVDLAEIQVRTVFEEGWSEIDHRIRYPRANGSLLIEQLLVIFNRLAGSADEIGSYIRALSAALCERDKKHRDEVFELERVIRDLEDKITRMSADEAEKFELPSTIAALKQIKFSPPSIDESILKGFIEYSNNVGKDINAVAMKSFASFLSAGSSLDPTVQERISAILGTSGHGERRQAILPILNPREESEVKLVDE